MKIVYVYPQLVEKAGTERILTDKMNCLADQYGFDIVLLTYEQCSRPLSFSLSPKVRHIDLDMHYYTFYRYNLFYRLLKWRQQDQILQAKYNSFISEFIPDIVVTTTSYARPVLMVSKGAEKYIKVLESHIDRRYIMNNNPRNQRNPKEWFLGLKDMFCLTKSARKFDLLVALTQTDALDWSRFLKTKVITNMVHLNPTGQIAKLENNRVIFVGRYTNQKGISDLFRIWKIVHLRYPDWHLDLYGEGELRDKLLKEAEILDANIHINAPSSRIFDCYLNSSILVLTSLYEPFGLVIPEAMSCGLPVVAFDCAEGPRQIITDGVDGFLVPKRSVKTFADKLCSLLESQELRLKMRDNALLTARRYSFTEVMPIWVDLFEYLKNSCFL